MKKLLSAALAIVLTFALAACGCQAREPMPTTIPTTTPTTVAPTTRPTEATTAPTTMPVTDPTIETNIPDPSVDASIPEATDMIDGVSPTDETRVDSRMRRR